MTIRLELNRLHLSTINLLQQNYSKSSLHDSIYQNLFFTYSILFFLCDKFTYSILYKQICFFFKIIFIVNLNKRA